MSSFKRFKQAVSEQFEKMSKDQLFIVDLEKDALWNMYLDSFPEGTNEIYRERREHDCQCCKSFIRRAGNIVSINKNMELVSIWDIEVESPYNVVTEALSSFIKSHEILNQLLSKEPCAGVDKSRQLLEDESVKTWEHFYVKFPCSYVASGSDSVESQLGHKSADFQVFERSMRELTTFAGEAVLELIDQGSLYRGEEHKKAVSEFIRVKKQYDIIDDIKKRSWCWLKASGSSITRIRNTALGTLLIDLSNGVDLDESVTKFEKVMAPSNYKRPKAIFTKKMVEDAQSKIQELGLESSLGRRFAILDDITVNNVLFVNRDAKKAMGVFDELKSDVVTSPKKFSKVEEVSIDDFVANILPHAESIELLMEGKHNGNLMNLIAPENKTAKGMFKWGNNFSWSYNGDIADSMKQNVKNAGGNVDGVLRFSIQWNDGDNNQNDFDAHCVEPSGNEIYYSSKRNGVTGGNLDVDITQPRSEVAVENITWPDESRMQEGEYKFFVRNYSHNGGQTGFTAEIEYNGEIYSYSYDKELRNKENVEVATIKYSKAKGIEFIKSLDSSQTSREIWGINTNNFAKVTSLMMSPNYWDDQKGNGNRHFFFIMENCITDGTPRGFYNEFLKDDLLKHKRVFEALGSKMRVPESDNQLSGLGFSSTQRNSIVAKIEGSFSRVVRINF